MSNTEGVRYRKNDRATYLRTSCRIFISCCCNSVMTSTPSVRHSGRAPTHTRRHLTYSWAYGSASVCLDLLYILIQPTVPFFNDPEGLELQLHVLVNHQWAKDLEVICSQNWLEYCLKNKKTEHQWRSHPAPDPFTGCSNVWNSCCFHWLALLNKLLRIIIYWEDNEAMSMSYPRRI